MNEHPHRTPDDGTGPTPVLDEAMRAFRESLGTAPHTVTEMASLQFRESARRRSISAARIMLVLAAIAGLAFDVPVLLGTAHHTSQDVAVLHTAMTIGFLLAAWRPARYARGLAPVSLVAAVLLALPLSASGGDPVNTGINELSHLPLLVGAATLTFGGWMTAPRRARV